MNKLLRSMWHKRLLMGRGSWWAVFILCKMLRPFLSSFASQKIEVLNHNQVSIILTPLCGSSSLKAQFKSEVSSKIEHSEVYMLGRAFPERCKSFHTKKIIFCDSIGKVWLLSHIKGLRRSTSYCDFVELIARNKTAHRLEKHLWTAGEILEFFNVPANEVECLHIGDQKLRDVLGLKEIPTINSSAQLAGSQGAVDRSVKCCGPKLVEKLAKYEKTIGANV